MDSSSVEAVMDWLYTNIFYITFNLIDIQIIIIDIQIDENALLFYSCLVDNGLLLLLSLRVEGIYWRNLALSRIQKIIELMLC
jgi:hypothetical protein